MNQIQSGFTSIQQVTDTYLKNSNKSSNVNISDSFASYLQSQIDEATKAGEVKFSKHASKRLDDRDIVMTEDQKIRLNEGVQKAEAKGIPTIIVTGNVVNYAYATEVLIGCSGGLVCENGGVVFKEGENNNAVETMVDRDFVTSAEKHLKEKLGDKFNQHASHDNMYRLTETVFYKTIDRKELDDALKDFEYLDQLEIYDSGFALHITDKRVNKGTSLRYLCERNGINMENVMGIGDSQNDEDFLKETGYKIAVGNAEDKLKEISTYTCEKMFGDGVAEAIEKFAL